MKPIFSDTERSAAVRNFIASFYQGSLKITNYRILADYLEDERITPLREMEPHYYYTSGAIKQLGYTSTDAEAYFIWLMGIVTGAEKVKSENLINNATDQIFFLISALRNCIDMDGGRTRLIAPYNWEDQLTVFSDRIARLQKTIDRRDELSANVMEKIYAWLTEFTPILEEVKKDYSGKLGKAMKK
jgi:hypothetical protein